MVYWSVNDRKAAGHAPVLVSSTVAREVTRLGGYTLQSSPKMLKKNSCGPMLLVATFGQKVAGVERAAA